MRKTLLALMFISCFMLIFSLSSNSATLRGGGGKLAYILPDNAKKTIGIAVFGDIGAFYMQMPQLRGEISAEYWGSSKDDWTIASIILSGTGKYHFVKDSNVSPFIGGGIAFSISRKEWKSSIIENNNDIDPHFVAGIDIVGKDMKIVSEFKYYIGSNMTEIAVGLAYGAYEFEP
jgi:outer membrane protein W